MRFLLLIGVVTWHSTSSNAMSVEPANNVGLEAVTRSANTFSPNFFKAVAKNVPGNLICSPISASVVLSMAAYGARGNTAKQMRTSLALPEDDALAKSGFQTFIDSFSNYKQVELRLANKIYIGNGFSPKPEFKDLTKTSFRSEAQNLDFGKSVESSKTINDWCEAQTNSRITNLIKPDDLNTNTALVLVNAVYFKGNWESKFNVADTKPRPFHVNHTTEKNVPTMFRTGSYRYGELPEIKAKFVELPYKRNGTNDSISMFIILPDEINGIADLEKNIEKVTIEKLLKGSLRDVNVYLPKFKIESEIPLNAPLSEMGMSDMFLDRADFTGIAESPPLKISKVIQKAFIEVNEEGSEAAAATANIISADALGPGWDQLDDKIEMRIDHPFHYVITRSESTFIFQGLVIDPTPKID